MIKNFEDLEIWKCSRVLTKEIYRLTADQKFSRDFKFRDQIRGAVISIMSNIAEGYERGGNQEFIQFLYIAKASCGEVRSLLYVALDEGYLTPKQFEELIESFKRLSVMTSNLIDYLRRSSFKGAKYNEAAPGNRSPAPNRPQTA